MSRFHRIRAGVVIASAAVAGLSASQTGSVRATGRLIVAPNVLVSGVHGAMPHMEVTACADPTHASTLLVASMATRRGHWITLVYRSADGGRSWKPVFETAGPGGYGDPTCVFDDSGRVFYGVLWARFDELRLRGVPSMKTLIHTSMDGGKTWPHDPATQMMIDRPFLTLDRSGAPGRNYIYYSALWVSDSLTGRDSTKRDVEDPNVETAIAIFASGDNGKTFGLAASPRHGRNGDWAYGPGNSVVTATGEIVTLFRVLRDRFRLPYNQRTDGDMLSVLRSTPGAEHTEPSVPIGIVRGNTFPSLGIDATRDGPFHGRLYAAALDGGRIVLFRSADDGRTWHGPTVVHDANRPDASPELTLFNPSVAVNRDGVVGVAWAEGTESRKTPYIRSWTYRMAASWDGGETFLETVNVSSDRHDAARVASIPLLGSVRRDGGRQLAAVRVDPFPDGGGHTFGLVANAAGVFHAAWTDNRTGVSQVWTAAVRAEPSVARATAKP